jgi:hypothetical protein
VSSLESCSTRSTKKTLAKDSIELLNIKSLIVKLVKTHFSEFLMIRLLKRGVRVTSRFAEVKFGDYEISVHFVFLFSRVTCSCSC